MKFAGEFFWVDRWMASRAFLLPMDARGLYREMLSQAWLRGARLPADEEAIRRAVGATEAEWARCWPLVERFWKRDGDSLVNETQLKVYAEKHEQAERASERGRKARSARGLRLLK